MGRVWPSARSLRRLLPYPCPNPARDCRWRGAGWCHDDSDPQARPRGLLPRRELAGPALRRRLLHRGPHDRHLLPPLVPGPDAGGAQRGVPPDGGRGPGGRVPGVQALPARRHARQPRVGRRRRRRRPGDAADLRRRRRPRGRRRAGRARRLHATPPEPAAHRRARRRPAGPGPRASGADGARAHRDDRPAVRGDRLRGRLREHPAVQRHDPRGLRALADRAPRASRRRASLDGHGDHAAGRPDAVRRS